jgi:hypothetical protein
MELICDNCEKTFQRIRPKKTKYKFCCKDCHKLWRKNKIKINKCKFCDKDTTNPVFCCKSCAASYNNKEFPKRIKGDSTKIKGDSTKKCPIKKYSIKEKFCIVCGIQVNYRSKYCLEHNPQYVDWNKITLGDIVYNEDQVKANRYTKVRDNSKRIYFSSNRPQECSHCGYSKHFEVCHIKPIHMFDLTTPISAINSLDNLIALCPNCHWEFDNGLIPVPLRGLEPRT